MNRPAPRPFVRVWPTWVAFVVTAALSFVAAGAVSAFVVFARHARAGGGAPPSAEAFKQLARDPAAMGEALPWMGLATALTFAAAALLGAARSREALLERLRLRAPAAPFGPAQWAAALVGTFALGVAVASAFELIGLARYSSLRDLDAAFRAVTGPAFWALLAVVSLGAGFAEELFFRGFMLTRFAAKYGPRAGIALTAVCFGLCHLDVMHAPLAAAIGAFLGWVSLRARSLWPAIAAHVVNNAVHTGLSRFGGEPTPGWALGVAVVAGVAAVVGCVRVLRPGAPAERAVAALGRVPASTATP